MLFWPSFDHLISGEKDGQIEPAQVVCCPDKYLKRYQENPMENWGEEEIGRPEIENMIFEIQDRLENTLLSKLVPSAFGGS